MIAIDTNIISTFLRGGEVTIPDGELFVPYAVEAELRYGVSIGGNPKKHEAVVDEFLNQKQIVLSNGLSKSALHHYVTIRAYLKKQGSPISPNDLWIAAECADLDLPLLTLDDDFDKVPQISRW